MKKTLSPKYAFAIVILIQVCNSMILGFTNNVGTDTWISLLLTTVFSMPIMLIYARLVHLMPGKNLYEMLNMIFGRFGGILISILYAFYFITLAAITRGYYGEFVHLVSLEKTSLIIILFSFFIVCTYIAVSGIRVSGKWCYIILCLCIFIVIGSTLLSINVMNMDNMLPMFNHSMKDINVSALKGVALPICESIIVLGMADKFDKKVNPYKLFTLSVVISLVFFLIIFFQNMAVLGESIINTTNFPYYRATSIINLGSIGSRVEAAVLLAFLLAGISKVSVGLTAGSRAIANIFNIKYKSLLVCISFFSVAISIFAFQAFTDLFDFIEIYPIYAIPIQIIIPVALWITAEIKFKIKKVPIKKCWKEPMETYPLETDACDNGELA